MSQFGKRSIRERYRRLLGSDPAADVEDEIAFHLEMRTRELIALGEPPARARELALRRFGDTESPRAECLTIAKRKEWRVARVEYLSELRQDLAYAVRAMRQRRGFTIVAVLTLALGIGANTAIFSVVNGVLLESLPFRNPDQLIRIRTAYPNGKSYALSAPDFMSVREGSRVFTDVAAFAFGSSTLLGMGEPKQLQRTGVTAGFFEMLGVSPVIGRTFRAEEHRPGEGRVVVLSHGLWQREFGREPGVLGRTLTLSDEPYLVVGVLPSGFDYPSGSELYVPLEYGETFSATTAQGRRGEFLYVLGRAKPGVSLEQAEADVRAVGARLQQEFPETNARLTFDAVRLRDILVGDVRKPLLVLLGAVGLVLLIACANVANLLLARAAARESELAVRMALGAERGRLVRQLLTESVVLGLVGGAAGLLLAYWGTRALVAARPQGIPRLGEVGIDGTVVAFTAGIALLTGIVFGIVPALQATRHDLVGALKAGGRGGAARRGGNRLRGGLVVAEMALAVMLLVGAGLLIRSFVALTAVDPGFRPEGAVAISVSLQGGAYRDVARRREFFATLSERLEALPGVSGVGGTSGLPLAGGADMLGFRIENREPPPNEVLEIRAHRVTPGYFRVVGVPLRRGRMLTAQDREGAPRVVVINEAAAQRWFPDDDPIGKRLVIGDPIEIVGIVGDVKQRSLARDVEPEIYAPYAQWPDRTMQMVVRSSCPAKAGECDPLALSAAIRRELRALDQNLPLGELTPLESVVRESVAQPRFFTALLGLFAAVALALAAIGIFGVMSYAVAQRTREIGVRVALGARPREVVRMIVRRALALAAAGVVLGLIGAAALTRVMESLLFGVRPTDPLAFAAAVLVLTATAGLASYVPARRAAAVDPIVALRAE